MISAINSSMQSQHKLQVIKRNDSQPTQGTKANVSFGFDPSLPESISVIASVAGVIGGLFFFLACLRPQITKR